jgi:hypothetical protein
LIKTINQDLRRTCEINQIPYNIKSHSFRINMISQLLKNTSVQNAADIIGHKDIRAATVAILILRSAKVSAAFMN